MKKLLALLLTMALLLGCTAFAETAVDYTGVWVLTGVETEEVTVDMTLLNLLGMSMSMTINADGTMYTDAMGVKEEGTWVVTATGIAITYDEETLQVVYTDDMLRIGEEGKAMMLTREGAAPAVAAKETATVLANVDPAAFEGTWTLTTMNLLGIEMSAAEMGMQMEFVLADGSGTITIREDEDEPFTGPVAYVISEGEGAGTVMTITEVETETGAEEEIMSLCMTSEDTLVWEMEEDGLSVGYVFSRKAE